MSSLLHAARSLLQLTIFAHRKSFSDETFAKIKTSYPPSSMQAHSDKEKEIDGLILLLESSAHPKFKFLIEPVIQPLLKELYLKCSSEGPMYNVGFSWLRLGELRFQLLLGVKFDPTAKYSNKHTRLLEKISSLELEMEVREECNYLAGLLSTGDVNGKLSLTLDSLKDELKMLEKKIVFRNDPGKFSKLMKEMEGNGFRDIVSSAMRMVKDPNNFEVDDFVDRAKSWQATANAFIDRLSDDYTGYDDIIQPFQVAVYEMKLGLSLVVSSILEYGFPHRLLEDVHGPAMKALFSFMRFPRERGLKTSMDVKMMPSEFPSCTIVYFTRNWAENMRVTMKFLKDAIVVGSGKTVREVSPTLCQYVVGRVVSLVATTRVMDYETFMVLDELYADFADIWMKMKVEEETTKNSRSQGYLFKPRAYKIEDIYEIDLSTLEGSLSSSSYAEWNESLQGDDMKESVDEPETSKLWNAIEESALRTMVATHNELFGSINLIGNVIPYVASHYRKDKIWLRRTRPNKRDYQVVIAVDDSHSMLESGCGDVAIEALVTVCRAMSQLEVGKLAVASFGKEGNIKLLHDFEQPFTGEAGIKMVSSLTFKQENTIVEEPMVDLLTYLNHMLDEAAVNARLPSGQNPLQQLVLIIADGRFHEKDKLKRYVRELMNQKRMVAFLLVDSSRESILQLKEASFEDGKMKIANYLDTFPFPYYIILNNIEAFPRTLADLLRQWFEIMQYARD